MKIKCATGVNPEVYKLGEQVFDSYGALVGTIVHDPSVLTRQQFALIPAGTVFKIVTTCLQSIEQPMKKTLKFICKKGKANDWAIYYGEQSLHDYQISITGNKVRSYEHIQEICPCTPEVLSLYRQ